MLLVGRKCFNQWRTISDSIEGESGGLKRSRQDISALDYQCLPPGCALFMRSDISIH